MKALNTAIFRQHLDKGDLIIDTRPSQDFATAFIPGSLSIPGGETLPAIAKILLPSPSTILLVSANGDENNISALLEKEGHTVEGFLDGGIESWLKENLETDLVIQIDPDELLMDLPYDKNLSLVDLRSPEEFATAHLEQAINMPFSDLSDLSMIASADELQNIYLLAASDEESIAAASLFKKHGIHHLRTITGGWEKVKAEEKVKIVKDQSNLN